LFPKEGEECLVEAWGLWAVFPFFWAHSGQQPDQRRHLEGRPCGRFVVAVVGGGLAVAVVGVAAVALPGTAYYHGAHIGAFSDGTRLPVVVAIDAVDFVAADDVVAQNLQLVLPRHCQRDDFLDEVYRLF